MNQTAQSQQLQELGSQIIHQNASTTEYQPKNVGGASFQDSMFMALRPKPPPQNFSSKALNFYSSEYAASQNQDNILVQSQTNEMAARTQKLDSIAQDQPQRNKLQSNFDIQRNTMRNDNMRTTASGVTLSNLMSQLQQNADQNENTGPRKQSKKYAINLGQNVSYRIENHPPHHVSFPLLGRSIQEERPIWKPPRGQILSSRLLRARDAPKNRHAGHDEETESKDWNPRQHHFFKRSRHELEKARERPCEYHQFSYQERRGKYKKF